MRILRSEYLQYKSETTTVHSIESIENDAAKIGSGRTLQQHILSRRNSFFVQQGSTSTVTSSLLSSASSALTAPVSDHADTQPARRSSVYVPPGAIDITPAIDYSLSGAKALPICKHRQTSASLSTITESTQQEATQRDDSNLFSITLLNPGGNYSEVNIILHFGDDEPQIYTKLYRTYEGILWHKTRRRSTSKNCKWYFVCHKCRYKLCSFVTLRNHLNMHMKFYPYVCQHCPKRYANSSSFGKHKKTKHPDKQSNLQLTKATAGYKA